MKDTTTITSSSLLLRLAANAVDEAGISDHHICINIYTDEFKVQVFDWPTADRLATTLFGDLYMLTDRTVGDVIHRTAKGTFAGLSVTVVVVLNPEEAAR